MFLKNMGEEGKIRLENVQELKSNILKYMKESELPSLENFLEEVSLYADAEQTETAPDTVSMMTIHAAKGLEFKTVFLIGMEENIFPSARSINSLDENDLEEERRLAYVAITRAKKQLCVSTTDRRMLFGMTTSNPHSRFLGEIQGDCMEQVQRRKMSQQEQEKWKWYSQFLYSSSLQAEEIIIRKKLLQNLSIIQLAQECGIKFSGKERFFLSPIWQMIPCWKLDLTKLERKKSWQTLQVPKCR